MTSTTIPIRRIISVILVVIMVFGGGLVTGLTQEVETFRKNRVPPKRDQAVAMLQEIKSSFKTGDVKPVFMHLHRAPEWDKKQFDHQVQFCFEHLFSKREPDVSAIEELLRDGIWGPATGLIDKDRLRRRAALHRVKPGACYSLALKGGRTKAVFHWDGAKLTILHYEDAARRAALRDYFSELLEDFPGTDPSGIALTFYHLRKMGPDAEAAIPTLSKFLTNDDAEMRMRAASALWKIDRKTTVSLPPLLAVLTDKEMSASSRKMAANCLWIIGPDAKSAAPALAAAMGEEDLKLRTVSAVALWKIAGDSDSTTPVLIESLKGEDLNASSAAGRTLAEIISTLREDPDRKAFTEQVTRQILEIFTSKEKRIRIAAIAVLAQIGGDKPAVIEALKKALKDEDVVMRHTVTRTLEKYNSSLPRKSRKAGISLPPLIAILTDKEILVSDRMVAVECLVMIGPDARSAAPALTAGMGEDNLELRMSCVTALWKIAGDTGATIPVLLQSLKDTEHETPWVTQMTLAEMISTLREDPSRKAVAKQLTRQILELSTSKEVRARMAAITVLAHITMSARFRGDPPAAIEALKKALKDDDVSIRDTAASAIEYDNRKPPREGQKSEDDPEKHAPETNPKKVPNPYGVPRDLRGGHRAIGVPTLICLE